MCICADSKHSAFALIKGHIHRSRLLLPGGGRVPVLLAPVEDVQGAGAPTLDDSRPVEDIGDDRETASIRPQQAHVIGNELIPDEIQPHEDPENSDPPGMYNSIKKTW